MDENREKVSEESVYIENKKNEEYRIWRALLIASIIVGACYFICSFILRLIGNHFTDGSARISAENMAVIKSIVDKVIMIIQPRLVIVILALTLYSSIRFSLKKTAALGVVYVVVSFIIFLKSYTSYLNMMQLSQYAAATSIVSMESDEFISNIILILVNLTAALLLPKILKKPKNTFAFYSLCVLIVAFLSWMINILFALFQNFNLSGIILKSLIMHFSIYFVVMELTYAVICIVLHFKGRKKAEIEE